MEERVTDLPFKIGETLCSVEDAIDLDDVFREAE